MRQSQFRTNKKYFHATLSYKTNINGALRDLDWLFIQNVIKKKCNEFEIEIQCLLMMDTHVHLIISTICGTENYFCESVQIALSQTETLENLSEPISNLSQYLNTYKYIYFNPVAANICRQVEDYRFSSLHALIGKSIMVLKVSDQLGLIQNPFRILKWLNEERDYKESQLRWIT